MKLREIAFSKSGDKQDRSNIALFPYNEDYYESLREWLTADIVAKKYAPIVNGPVMRFEFPNMKGFNFLLYGAQGGGGSLSLRSDRMGKAHQSLILDIDVPEPWNEYYAKT
jgi:hypothetical protein